MTTFQEINKIQNNIENNINQINNKIIFTTLNNNIYLLKKSKTKSQKIKYFIQKYEEFINDVNFDLNNIKWFLFYNVPNINNKYICEIQKLILI